MTEADKENETLRKEIGLRFKAFRNSIKKSQQELAKELRVSRSRISGIENGKIFPSIPVPYYLNMKYHLSINWLFAGKEDMILKPEDYFKAVDLSELFSYIDTDDPMYEQYVELRKLMQIPTIERTIFAKLASLKKIAAEEIKEFFKGT